jgi:hypothetical protein
MTADVATARRPTFLYVLTYFTTWSVLAVVFHAHTYRYVNLLFLTFVTLVIGLYMSFVNPRKFVFYFDRDRYEFTGGQKFVIVDMLFHLGAFWFAWEKYGRYYLGGGEGLTSTWAAAAIFAGYALIMPLRKIYGVELKELGVVAAIAMMLYFVIFEV